MPFLDSLDIANRAVQILGGEQISSPTEDSSRNVELAFAYDKLRRPELRRNLWRFAIRQAVLRAIGSGSMLLQPAQWASGTIYVPGSIVSDANNVLWISTAENNFNNDPNGNDDVWDTYFGTLTVQAYDTTGQTAYYAGDLVYVPGSGTGTGPLANGGFQIYLSLTNSNQDPPYPASAWSSSTTYALGQVVVGSDNVAYSSSQAGNLNHNPAGGANSSYWSVSTNISAWSSTATYYDGQQVYYNNAYWISNISFNLGNIPTAGPGLWLPSATYNLGAIVTASNGFQYLAQIQSSGVDPSVASNLAYWAPLNILTAWSQVSTPPSDIQWVAISAAMKNIIFTYPIGTGPVQDTASKNVYRLPSGYLRNAPQAPKDGNISILGAPTGDMQLDWVFQGNYLISEDFGPILLRFCADVVKVKDFDDLFSEGLAARCAMEVCEKLTQSQGKFQQARALYLSSITEARVINAIETGADQPPMDDWIATRI